MAVTDEHLFALPPTVAGRRRRQRTWIAVPVVLALIAAGLYVLIAGPTAPCALQVENIGGECIGVNAGDYAFNPTDPQFSAAENRIWTLNQQVVRSGRPYVTVALLTSLTWTATSSLSREKIVHQLEGAAIALDRVDNKAVTGDAPLIELLLANEGTDEDHYDAVVSQLTGMTAGDHPLDAVIGMGVSSGATLHGAQQLSRAGILMVASNLTGDILDSTQVPGLSRVSPPNRDDVAAIAQYLATRPDLHKTMLVHAASKPLNSADDHADYYTSSLADDFTKQLGQYATVPSEPFDYPDSGNSFSVIATNLCTSTNPPDVVLYAGREPVLPQFIHQLAQRPCNSSPITIVVGSDAAALESDPANPQQTAQINADLAAGKITVLCPAWVAPQTWAESSAAASNAPAGFAAFETEFDAQFTTNGSFGASLADGYALMTHDALLTAAKAIRLATQPSVTAPTPGQVLGNQYRMDSANSVPGAAGTLTFVETDNGNPANKPVFVLQLEPSGPPILLYTYKNP